MKELTYILQLRPPAVNTAAPMAGPYWRNGRGVYTQGETSPVWFWSNLNWEASHLYSQVSYSSYFRFHGHLLVKHRYIIEASSPRSLVSPLPWPSGLWYSCPLLIITLITQVLIIAPLTFTHKLKSCWLSVVGWSGFYHVAVIVINTPPRQPQQVQDLSFTVSSFLTDYKDGMFFSETISCQQCCSTSNLMSLKMEQSSGRSSLVEFPTSAG